jgi:transcriptional regulator with XRE-family HTH domain
MRCRTVGAREDARRRRRRTGEIRSALGAEIRRLRTDAGISLTHLARGAGISPAHLSGIELGRSEGSTAVLVAIADQLGADLSIRLYPGTGPRIRDHIQARIVEELLHVVHPRWRRFLEVPVYRPVRGVIDLVLHDPDAAVVVAVEVHSNLLRLEQQLRWAHEKADALPSAELWRSTRPATTASRLLVLRSTRTTRELAMRFGALLATAYPARPADVHAALSTADAPWAGAGLLWATLEGDVAAIMDRPPRRVRARA